MVLVQRLLERPQEGRAVDLACGAGEGTTKRQCELVQGICFGSSRCHDEAGENQRYEHRARMGRHVNVGKSLSLIARRPAFQGAYKRVDRVSCLKNFQVPKCNS